MLFKYSCYFLRCVTFRVLNVVSRLKACSEASLAAFRFFKKMWAVMWLLFCCQHFGSAFIKPWSTFRSGSSVQEYFPARSTSETSSVRRGMCGRTILLLCLGWCRSALAIAHFSLRGTESLKMTRRLSVVTTTKCDCQLYISTNQPATNWDLFSVFCADPGLSLVHLLGLQVFQCKFGTCHNLSIQLSIISEAWVIHQDIWNYSANFTCAPFKETISAEGCLHFVRKQRHCFVIIKNNINFSSIITTNV